VDPNLSQLILAQLLDKRQVVLQRRLDSLPVELTEREASFAALQAEADEVAAERKASLARSNDLENQVRTRDERIAKLEKSALESMDPSSAQVARHEAEAHRKSNSDDQEEALELLDRADTLDEKRKELAGKIEEIEGDLMAFRSNVEQDQQDLQKECVALAAQRTEFVDKVPSPMLSAFETLSAKHPGKAVVPLKGDSCGGCGTRLVPNDRVRVQAAKSMIRCPACTRILVTQEMWAKASETVEP
jgi:predicted  nucleic acid-binding Zn-ribbon protein